MQLYYSIAWLPGSLLFVASKFLRVSGSAGTTLVRSQQTSGVENK